MSVVPVPDALIPPSVGALADSEADIEPSLSDVLASVEAWLSLFEAEADAVSPPLSPQPTGTAIAPIAPAIAHLLIHVVCTKAGYALPPGPSNRPLLPTALGAHARLRHTPGVTTFYWDYFGPDAEGTARHFLAHLGDYLARAGVPDCERGVESPGPGRWAVWCRAPGDAREAVLRLRPRRAEPAP